MPRFFVPRKNLHDNRASIEGEELEHLRRVLRLGPGDSITLFDDTGWEHEAVIRDFLAGRAEAEIRTSYQPQRESLLDLTLALGLTKGPKMDFVIEKATELGVQTITPFVSTYTVPQLDEDRSARRTERWRKIALSAAKQSGRTRIPQISPIITFNDLVGRTEPQTLKLLFWEQETEQGLGHIYEMRPNVHSIMTVIGPEGGFTAEEAKEAIESGFHVVRLGRRTLRAETAAVAALALVQSWWGDMD
jgi:16S rRNA (uracil1498-N3)-methyltransferase